MRSLIIAAAAAVMAVTALAIALQAACGDVPRHLPAWALFSFAVSAFREPLR